MIKLTKREDAFLKRFCISNEHLKANLIEFLYQKDRYLSNLFNTSELKLKAIQAILDGEWEVEEPLYYVHLMSFECGYLNIGKYSDFKWLSTKREGKTYKTKFTRAEVKAIDPRYLEFLEEVE